MAGAKIHADVWSGLGVTPWVSKPGFQPSAKESSVMLTEQTADPLPSEAGLLPATAQSWVLLGTGLNAIWQNQDNQAWSLWQAMIHQHLDSIESLVFYDTEHLISEEQQFDVLESIIELGVETVFSMDAEHPINEALAEGVQLVVIPSFDQLLDQPLLKRDVYQALMTANLKASWF